MTSHETQEYKNGVQKSENATHTCMHVSAVYGVVIWSLNRVLRSACSINCALHIAVRTVNSYYLLYWLEERNLLSGKKIFELAKLWSLVAVRKILPWIYRNLQVLYELVVCIRRRKALYFPGNFGLNTVGLTTDLKKNIENFVRLYFLCFTTFRNFLILLTF